MATNFLSSTVSAGDTATATQYNNLRKDALQNAGDYEDTGGAANAYTLAIDGAIAALSAGLVIRFKASFSSSGATTMNVNGLGAVAMKKNISQDTGTNDILSGGSYEITHDGTNFQLTAGHRAIGNQYLGAKGSIVQASAALTPAELAIGTEGQTPTVSVGGDLAYEHAKTPGSRFGANYNFQLSCQHFTAISAAITSTFHYALVNSADTTNGFRETLIALVPAPLMTTITQLEFETGFYFDDGGADVDGRLGVGTQTSFVVAYNSTAQNFVGVSFDGSTNTLYATTCSGGAVTNTSIATGVAVQTSMRIRVVYTTTSVKFYLNGTLVATHTTNIPALAGSSYFGLGTVEVSATASGHGGEMMLPVLSIKASELFV